MTQPFGLTANLVGAAVVCAVVAHLLFLRRRLPPAVAIAVLAVKFALPVVYFAWMFDGTWTFVDDYTYLRASARLLAEGETPLTVLTDPVLLVRLDSWAGVQFGYGWWNMVAQQLIGPYYYAPVLFNVALSCGAAAALHALALEAGAGRTYARALMVFFLLHWEVLSWSSVLNLKDVVIFTLAPAALLLAARARRKVTVGRIAGLFAIAGVFLTIRPYSIVLIGAAVLAWVALDRGGLSRRRLVQLLGAAVAVVALLLPFVRPLIGLAIYAFTNVVNLAPAALAYNAVWFLLTPQPWAISADHGFMQLSSFLHLIFLGPALVTSVMLWRRGGIPRLLLLYFVFVLLLNMLAPQSVRHRLQGVFVIAWLQFHFLWVLAAAAARAVRPQPDAGDPHDRRDRALASSGAR